MTARNRRNGVDASMQNDRDDNADISSDTFRSGVSSGKKPDVLGREGKVHIGAYLDPEFRRALRMVQAQTDKDLQELLAEALKDLFVKHNVRFIASGN